MGAYSCRLKSGLLVEASSCVRRYICAKSGVRRKTSNATPRRRLSVAVDGGKSTRSQAKESTCSAFSSIETAAGRSLLSNRVDMLRLQQHRNRSRSLSPFKSPKDLECFPMGHSRRLKKTRM